MYKSYLGTSSGIGSSSNARHPKKSEITAFDFGLGSISGSGFGSGISGRRNAPGQMYFEIGQQDSLVPHLIAKLSGGEKLREVYVTIDELDSKGEFRSFQALEFFDCLIAQTSPVKQNNTTSFTISYARMEARTNWVEA